MNWLSLMTSDNFRPLTRQAMDAIMTKSYTSDEPVRLYYAGSIIVKQQNNPALQRAYDSWYYTSNTTTSYRCPTCQHWYTQDYIIDKHEHPCLDNLRIYRTQPYYAEYHVGTRRPK